MVSERLTHLNEFRPLEAFEIDMVSGAGDPPKTLKEWAHEKGVEFAEWLEDVWENLTT